MIDIVQELTPVYRIEDVARAIGVSTNTMHQRCHRLNISARDINLAALVRLWSAGYLKPARTYTRRNA